MGIMLIFVGIVGVVGGIYGKEFYSGDVVSLSGYKHEKKVPIWFGRLIFFVVGASFIAVGIKLLVEAK